MKLRTCLLLLLVPVLLQAQRNFQKAYIVTLQGDTINGSIDYQEWSYTPAEILFKPDDGTNQVRHHAGSILGFEITGKEAYQCFPLRISTAPARLGEIEGKDTGTVFRTVFAKRLYAGKQLQLFAYADKIKERYYLLDSGATRPQELLNWQYYQDADRTRLVTEDVYRRQLVLAMHQHHRYTGQLTSKINMAGYSKTDLRKIVAAIDGGTDKSSSGIPGSGRPLRFFAGVGVQREQIRFSGDHFLAKQPATSSDPLLPAISAGLDILANPEVGKLLFRIELGYRLAGKSAITGTSNPGIKAVYEMERSTISLIPQVICNVYNLPRFKIPVGIGFGYSLSSYTGNRLTQSSMSQPTPAVVQNDPYKLQKGNVSLLARAGVVFGNKLEASFIYLPPVALTSYSLYGIRSAAMQLQVYYLLNRSSR